jgi:CRISPR-associated protein Cas5t
MASVACYVAAPIAAFRAPRAREYLETLAYPPPSTVYGMLLSAVGETNRLAHRGAELAVASISPGRRTRVLRTLWRVKSVREPLGSDTNKRPDFQELLTDVRLAVHVRDGIDAHDPPLSVRLQHAMENPATVQRFGGLALGESTHLVDELRLLRESDAPSGAGWLVRAVDGHLALPVWPDHVGGRQTRYVQLDIRPAQEVTDPPDAAWIRIEPLNGRSP